MKAIVVREFGEPEVMKLEDAPVPYPSGTQILVRVAAIGVNPVETYIRSGQMPGLPALPYTPGKDAAGIVEKVGGEVSVFAVGDRVYTADSVSGTYAEYSLCEEAHLGRLPDNTSFEAGAGIWTPYATAFRALFEKADAKSGETVFVHGASGGVGIAAIQWAKSAGLKVIGSAGSAEGKKLVQDLGADLVVDHLSAKDSTARDEIMAFTGGKGGEIIIEMLANINLQLDFDVLAMFGRIVVVGNRGTLDFNPRSIMGKDAAVHGLSLFNASQLTRDAIHRAIFEGLRAGFLKPVISKTMPLADAPQAHREIIENRAVGKIILTPWQCVSSP